MGINAILIISARDQLRRNLWEWKRAWRLIILEVM